MALKFQWINDRFSPRHGSIAHHTPPRHVKIQNSIKQAEIQRRISRDKFPIVPPEQWGEPIIPLNIFQTWDNLTPRMRWEIQRIKKMNPQFKHRVFTDRQCLEFIRKHFEPQVATAYQRLIPAAYRADLWRYCVLYIHGGIYMDIKYVPNNNFSFMELVDAEHFVVDHNGRDMYNGFMVCKPNNPILRRAIDCIVENVKNRNFGNGFLDVTGPALLARCIPTSSSMADMKHTMYGGNIQHRVILYKGKHILKCYPNYHAEQKRTGGEHYATLWHARKVFR